jgi:hypothetical protein
VRLLAKISCFLVGLLYIFSGFIKAVDPLGFSYKLEEYLIVGNLEFLDFSTLFMAFFLCALEIGIGISLLIRYNLKFWAPCSLLLIAFFTLLTGVSAIFDVVKDCGCFGDALKLTPEESFTKDLILLVLSGIIYRYRLYLFPVLKNQFANKLVMSLAVITSLLISYWGIKHLPMIDYRAYKIGNSLIEKMSDGIADKIESIFQYKSKETGEVRKLTTNEIMSINHEKWEFVDVEHKVIKEGKDASISDFMIIDEYGQERTMDILNESGTQIMVISYSIEDADKDAFISISNLSNDFDNVSFLGLTNGDADKNETLRHDIQAAFPFFSVDQTALKTMIRSNPGIIMIKKGVVIGKWHYNDLPNKAQIIESLN